MRSPLKIKWKGGITKEYMLNSSFVALFYGLWRPLFILTKKHVSLLENFATLTGH